MAEIRAGVYTESQRMELRTLIHLASEAVSYYWPMRTFVHHNPLHGLEDLPFEEAVQRAQRLLGGKGY
ncbi:MAG TPA: putative inorganic carbon transporter subunit DabA, partial [Terriglobales bacterium]|nr:putative inorganic carbon transporter subunit DabA [Terriglobales bacterium]